MENSDNDTRLVALTADIVAAYVGHNALPPAELVRLLTDVHTALLHIERRDIGEPLAEARPPAVPVKKSIRPDTLVCLEDGKAFKILKRHLHVHHDMTPEDYRKKWDLPDTYPMVAPNYSTARSHLAKDLGLGRKRAPAKAKRGGKAQAATA